jgi:feruloyl esterase
MLKVSSVLFFLLLVTTLNAVAQKDVITDGPEADSLLKKIRDLNIPGLNVTNIRFVQKGTPFKPANSAGEIKELPDFCLVAATLRPTPQSYIRIEVWLPQHNWNGRLLGTGNGGGAGGIAYAALANGLQRGYATANTDMGTSRGGANAAIGQPGVWADFGYRATHLMTVASKAILKTYYGKVQHHAYFMGCSTGGQQALMEAQRFPDDYNGIIAGAPANNRTHLHTGFLLNNRLMNEGGVKLFTDQELAFISRKIIATVAGKDGGAPGDNFLTDPAAVRINFDALFKCKSGGDTCLNDAQIAALKKIYAGAVNPLTGEQIYTAPPLGSENVSGGLIYQQTAKGANDLFYQFKWVFGDNFDASKFNFSTDMDKMDAMLAPILNANNADLEPIKKLGGKIIMYTGTADPLVPYQDAANYYERVVQQQHGLKQTQSFFRYFLVPGMGHCSGGPGLNGFGGKPDSEHDLLLAIVAWVENSKAPDKLIATALSCCGVPNPVRFQRPVYPYPKFPAYVKGDVNAPSSYKAVTHKTNNLLKPAEKYLK